MSGLWLLLLLVALFLAAPALGCLMAWGSIRELQRDWEEARS